MTEAAVEDLLYHRSGLLGVSGIRQRRQLNASARRQSCLIKERLRACSTPACVAIIVEQALSGDMRELAASDDPAAQAAIELFAYRLRSEIGRLTSALGGLDGLVFTAGIGEHDAGLRAEICRPLAWLGIVLDPIANTRGPGADGALRISSDDSRVAVWVIRTDEEAMIARHTQAVLSA